MAPEQAEGKTKDVGPAADIYALGAILYELLTGRPSFRGTTVLETLQQVKTAEPVPPSRLVPGLPRDIETICLKCLQKDPGRRYESAAALAEDLRRYQAGEPIVARLAGSAERAWRWCQRNPALAGLMATVATLLVAVALGATLSALRFRALS
jgi:serine/threonine protein kinase